MRILMIMAVLFGAQFANAAKWAKVDINQSVFAELADVKTYNWVYEFQGAKEGEEFENSLQQLTYIIRVGEWDIWSKPDDVGVWYTGDDQFSGLFEDDTRQEPYPATEDLRTQLGSFVDGKNIDIWEGNDGNSFGDCANVYLHEKSSNQVMMLSICYAE